MLPSSAIGGDADRAFKRWFDRYRAGRIDLREEVQVGIRGEDGVTRFHKEVATRELRDLLDQVVAQGDENAARILVDAATFELERDRVVEARRHADAQPWLLRRLAADALMRTDSPSVRSWLQDTVLSRPYREEDLLRHIVAARAIANTGDLSAVDPLRRLAAAPDPILRAEAARALATLGKKDGADALIALLGDGNQNVRLEALKGLSRWSERLEARLEATVDGSSSPEEELDRDFAEFLSTQRTTAARAALSDSDWASRLLGAEILGRRMDPESVPLLLQALLAEGTDNPAARRRVRTALRESLVALTGKEIPSTRPEDWMAWWEEARSSFQIDDVLHEVLPEQGPRFFGLPIETDVVCFIIDISGSMGRPAFGDGEPTRFFLAAREVAKCLKDLPPGTRANLVVFSDSVSAFRPAPVPLDAGTVAGMIAFLDGVEPAGGTDLYAALDQVIGLAEPLAAEAGADDLDLDTVVLLSDGVPSRGAVLDADELLGQVAEANLRRRIAIHTVAVGKGGQPFLAALAEQNHGGATTAR